jgi:hypothetical protein
MHKNINDPKYSPIVTDLMFEILGMDVLYTTYLDIYGADLLEDQETAYIVEGITRKIEREINQASTSQTLIGLLDMIAK